TDGHGSLRSPCPEAVDRDGSVSSGPLRRRIVACRDASAAPRPTERAMASSDTKEPGPLPPPWDRIFSLGTRIFVLGLIFAILYVLRPFFLLVFLTFVFAYILEHGVHGLQHRIDNRPLRVVLVTVVFLGALITLGVA